MVKIIYAASGSNALRAHLRANAENVLLNTNTDYTITDHLTVAFAYSDNDFAFYINGTQVATSTSGSVSFTSTNDHIKFQDGKDTSSMAAVVSQAIVFNTLLSNEELAALTTIV